MSQSFNFDKIIQSVIKKAEEDNIITQEEKNLIETIKLEGETIQNKIDNIVNNSDTKIALQKVLATSSKVMLNKLVSKAREDGRISPDEKKILEQLFNELGFNLKNFDSRPWYNFKICLKIDNKTPMDDLLDAFDRVFCLRGINPNDVYSGLCLGTKHYVIDEVDVTLLTFALTPDTSSEWVRKGAFATIEYGANFDRILYNTAYDLIVENYFSKIN